MPLRELKKTKTEDVEESINFTTKEIKEKKELESLGDGGNKKINKILTSPKDEEESITEESNSDIENMGEKNKTEKIQRKTRQIDLNKYFNSFRKISLKEKIFFTKNLSVMLKAGLSLGQALHALAEQTSNPKFKKILKEVEEKVKKGQSFADSLKDYPKTFSQLFVSMIKSGETAGNLEDVLKQLHKQMSRDHELISKIKGAMIYPIIVVSAMIGIGTAMVIFVIPKFITIFEEVEAELPLPTRILIYLSNFITNNGFFILLGLIILISMLIYFFRTPRGKRILHQIFLSLPIVSTIVKKVNLARFTRTLSSLLKTSIPIVDAFKIASDVLSNVYYKEALNSAGEKIKKGEPVAKCLAEYPKLFSAVVVQMASVGEESGSLDAVLEELANFYEDEMDQTMKNLPNIIEPILMLLLGAGVGAMAVAVLMPMYSLSQSI